MSTNMISNVCVICNMKLHVFCYNWASKKIKIQNSYFNHFQTNVSESAYSDFALHCDIGTKCDGGTQLSYPLFFFFHNKDWNVSKYQIGYQTNLALLQMCRKSSQLCQTSEKLRSMLLRLSYLVIYNGLITFVPLIICLLKSIWMWSLSYSTFVAKWFASLHQIILFQLKSNLLKCLYQIISFQIKSVEMHYLYGTILFIPIFIIW